MIGVSERLMVQWNKEFKEDISQRHLQELEILKEKYQLHSEYRTGNEIMQRSLKRNQFIE
ncbi:MAG: hypothetical protein APR63_11685 [Desulfuromonas sp. SDB]|nr:MAG: hypothetical protein APR63_11685 [Desulfuromonas sp. SDB]